MMYYTEHHHYMDFDKIYHFAQAYIDIRSLVPFCTKIRDRSLLCVSSSVWIFKISDQIEQLVAIQFDPKPVQLFDSESWIMLQYSIRF